MPQTNPRSSKAGEGGSKGTARMEAHTETDYGLPPRRSENESAEWGGEKGEGRVRVRGGILPWK